MQRTTDKCLIVHHGKPADGDRENFRKFLQPTQNPFFTVVRTFAQQEGASHTPRHAVVPASYGRVNEMRASHRH